MTNTLAYDGTELIRTVKSFMYRTLVKRHNTQHYNIQHDRLYCEIHIRNTQHMVMLSIVTSRLAEGPIFGYSEFHTAEYQYAECRYAECRYVECHYVECHYV